MTSKWEANRQAAVARIEADHARARARRAEERARQAEADAEQAALVSMAEQESQWKKKNTTVNAKDIEFADPKEFEVPSVVTGRHGRTYHADGSFSITTGEYDEYQTFYLPNGVIRTCYEGHLVREEIPDGRVREYKNGEIKYDRDADGNYKMYDDGVLREEGNSKGWQKRYYGDLGTKEGGRYSTHAEISSSGYYKIFGADYDLQEEGNFKTGEYQKYKKIVGKSCLVEDGVRERNFLDEDKYTSWEYKFERRDNYVKSKDIYDDHGRVCGKVMRGYKYDKDIPDFNETRPIDFGRDTKISEHAKIDVRYNLKSDGSGLYLAEAGPYEYDEKGRMLSNEDFRYKYHGDTNVVAEVEQKNGRRRNKYDTEGKLVEATLDGITEKYDDKGRLIQKGVDDHNCVKIQYWGDGEQTQLKQQISKGKVVDTKHWDMNGKNDTKTYLKVKARREVLRKIIADKIDERDAQNPDAKKERVIKNKTTTKLKATWEAMKSKEK